MLCEPSRAEMARELFLCLIAGDCLLSHLPGGRLRVYDPAHRLNDILREQIRRLKPELLRVFLPEDDDAGGRAGL